MFVLNNGIVLFIMSLNPRIVILGLEKSGKKTLLQGIEYGIFLIVGMSRYLEFDHTKKPERYTSIEIY